VMVRFQGNVRTVGAVWQAKEPQVAMPRRARWSLVGYLSFALALGSVAAIAGCHRSQTAITSERRATADLQPAWVTKTRYVYRLALAGSSQVAGGSNVELRVSGKLRVTPTSVRDTSVELATQLDEVHVEGGQDEGEADFKTFAEEIAQPHFVTLASARFAESHLAKGLSAIAASYQRTIGAALQLVPPAAAADTWKALEQDATGQYEVEYRLLPEPGKLARHKVRYQSLLASKMQLPVGVGLGGGSLSSSVEVVSSAGSTQLDASHRLAGVEYS
jgi:hypothetical protein